MPYFSFTLKEKIPLEFFGSGSDNIYNNIVLHTKYYCKNTHLWKKISSKKNIRYFKKISLEKRDKTKKIGKTILFCLPPSIGLGDAVEYALSIKAIVNSNKYQKVGVAFVESFKSVFTKYFDLINIYETLVSENSMEEYETIFHFTAEIKELSVQKYYRHNIENLIINFFKVPRFRKTNHNNNNKINKLSFFPISKSPIRSMPCDLLNALVDKYINDYDIEIILDNCSDISIYIENNITNKYVKKIYPPNLKTLLYIIENIQFGIFMDSGPLHVAKIINKKGILISSSVSGKILLDGFNTIDEIKNNYRSPYCNAPCGLTNIFNYDGNIGCFETTAITSDQVLKYNNIKLLQRGSLKKNYVNFIDNPVGCLKNIKLENIINILKKYI